MHFRTRQKVVQLIRTIYDPAEKRPRTVVVGRLSLDKPELSAELRAQLSESEVRETEAWIRNHERTALLREEFAALTLADTLNLTQSWLGRNAEKPEAAAVVSALLPAFHDFRKFLKTSNLL